MASAPPAITVFWRPSCVFCAALFGDLDRLDVPYEPQNIWERPEAAATVRRVAGGDLTVPTVLVGGEALVNPSVEAVLATAHRLEPSSGLPHPQAVGHGTGWLFRLLDGAFSN